MNPSPLERLDKWLIEEFTRPRTEQTPTLQQTTIQTPRQQEATRIKNEFEEYERRHFVVNNNVFLSILGVEEAYKSPSSRKTFLDNTTTYQPQISTDRIAVYVRGMYSIKELLICIHGTRLTSIEDIIQDIQVLENSVQNSPFTIKYLQDVIKIRNQFPHIPNDNVFISGHSLGAIYSLISSKVLNCNGFGFNGASSLLDIQLFSRIDLLGMIYDLKNIDNYPNYISFRIAGDFVSLLSKWTLKNVVTIDVKGISELSQFQKHSITTFSNVCIPLVPLDNSSLSRARRSGKLDDTRDGIPKEGQQFQQLREQTQPSHFSLFLFFAFTPRGYP